MAKKEYTADSIKVLKFPAYVRNRIVYLKPFFKKEQAAQFCFWRYHPTDDNFLSTILYTICGKEKAQWFANCFTN